MSTLAAEPAVRASWRPLLGPVWAPLLIGLALLYVPSFVRFGGSIWQREDFAHGPIVIGLAFWLIWKGLPVSVEGRAGGVGAWALLVFGLLCYIFGRSQWVTIFELGSMILVLTAAITLGFGWGAVRRLRFPLLFLLFAVPIPGPIVDKLTGPLKILVSFLSEGILATFGLPVARQGVILQVGQYQLLVADACSGLSSIFSLTALGLFYLYLINPRHQWRRWALIASVLPIAIAANVIRVMILMLITYFMGDEAGQGFLHGFAGMTLFIAALLMLLAMDGVFAAIERRRERV